VAVSGDLSSKPRPRFVERSLGPRPILEQLGLLDPLQTPPKKQLLVATHGGWTAHLHNTHLGGDSTAWTHHLGGVLRCRAVLATHIPVGQYPYPATQLEVRGDGHTRSVSAGVFDEGRWQFEAFGPEQGWEEPDRYRARRIRDRFDRELLLRYLELLGIEPDDPAFYGEGILVETRSWFEPRTTRIADEQERLAIRPVRAD
jgi:hypothetical protein